MTKYKCTFRSFPQKLTYFTFSGMTKSRSPREGKDSWKTKTETQIQIASSYGKGCTLPLQINAERNMKVWRDSIWLFWLPGKRGKKWIRLKMEGQREKEALRGGEGRKALQSEWQIKIKQKPNFRQQGRMVYLNNCIRGLYGTWPLPTPPHWSLYKAWLTKQAILKMTVDEECYKESNSLTAELVMRVMM